MTAAETSPDAPPLTGGGAAAGGRCVPAGPHSIGAVRGRSASADGPCKLHKPVSLCAHVERCQAADALDDCSASGSAVGQACSASTVEIVTHAVTRTSICGRLSAQPRCSWRLSMSVVASLQLVGRGCGVASPAFRRSAGTGRCRCTCHITRSRAVAADLRCCNSSWKACREMVGAAAASYDQQASSCRPCTRMTTSKSSQ